jgi:ABC-type glycerol-3-phosphate transport system substrate-binding protein
MNLLGRTGAALCVALMALPYAAQAGGRQEARAGRAEITLWMNQAPAMNTAYQELVDAYQAGHPGVSFKLEIFNYDTYLQTLQTAFPSGTEGDLIMMFGTWVKSYSGRLSKVPGSVLTPEAARSRILGATLGGYLFDGDLYGVPQEFNMEYGAVLLNTEMAREAGFDPSRGWKTWDDLIRDMKKTVRFDGGAMVRAGLGFCHMDGIAYTFLSLLKQYGGTPLNAKETGFAFSSPAGRKALQLMKRLVDERLTDPILFNDEENFVSDAIFGELMAGGIIGPWVIADYAEDFPEMIEKLTYVALPPVGSSPQFIAASGWGLTVSRNSPHQEQAWDFVRFAAVDERNAMSWNVGTATLPALKENIRKPAVDRLLDKYPYLRTHIDLVPHGVYQGHMPDSDMVLYDILYNGIHPYLRGNADVEETLALIQEQSDATF